MKLLLLTLTLFLPLLSQEIFPTFTIKSKGLVNDFVFEQDKIYIANDEGSVEIFDLNSRKKVDEIFINPIQTDRNEWQNSKILSVDRYRGKTLIVATSQNNTRDMWLHDGENLKLISKPKDQMFIREARFITEDKFLFGTVSYEMTLLDTTDNHYPFKNHVETSAFSDLAVSEDRKTYITVSESGQVYKSDSYTGEILKKYEAFNVDNIYQVAYKNGVVITAGQDRRVAVYPKTEKPYYIQNDFLVYSVGLSPSGEIGAYSKNEENHLQIFTTEKNREKQRLIGHKSIPTNIKFYDEKTLFSSGMESEVYFWEID